MQREDFLWYKIEQQRIIAHVYIQPGAKHSELVGLHGDALKIRIRARPTEGQANRALLNYIADRFQVPLRQVKLQKGEKSRSKIVIIEGSTIHPDAIYLPEST